MIPKELIIPPSETLLDLINDRGISKKDLSIITGVSRKYIYSLFNNKEKITNEFAYKLQYIFNIEPSFWINLQRNYDNELLEYQTMHSTYCENDIPVDIIQFSKQDNRYNLIRKYNGINKENKQYKRIYKINHKRYTPSGVYKKERDGKEYYKRYYRGKRSKYLKRLSNKAVRKYKGVISGKGGYKRLFDYWWELY